MTNTFMHPGNYDPNEIISSLDKGLYAVNFGGGQVDITNGKFVFSGGSRYTPVDLAASISADDTIYTDEIFSEKTGDYFRLDIGFSYRINKKRMTHTILFDIQNVTNRENIFEYFFDEETKMLAGDTQTGFFPFANYRIEF